ncbi:hypothetical protein [Methanofollis ethanolicus]|uniref:hypothetical protein n=1 Tax=Methanofollis ethanolicus TaxID=488124 RepID=UPI0008323B83|nr:hypothetical protein [Methanofollis ethanolicus]
MIQDFSIFVPDPVTLRIGRANQVKDLDLSVIPAKSSLRIIHFYEEKDGKDATSEEVVNLAAGVLHDIDPGVTEEWLWKNYSLRDLTRIATFVLERAATQESATPATGEAAKNV